MKITVKGQQAIVTDDFLVANSVGIYECEFEFDSAWDGFAKTSVWQLNNDEPKESIISSGVAEVPWEVLVNGGVIRVGVYGTKDEKVMPTVWGEKRKVHLGTPTGSIGTEPTPSIYAQILAVADEAKEIAEDVQSEWENVSATAETLPSGSEATVVFENDTFAFGIPQGEKGGNGEDGFSPIVTVAPITNGHRVTITDAEGVHTFDVLDGTDGADGVGITNIVMNADYTLTITLSNGTSFTTPSIRGEQGETGNGIASITKTATVGKVDTYTITYTDGTTTTFDVTNGEVTEASLEEALYDKADVILNTASGAIASFSDGSAMPVESLVVGIDAVQSGSGDPSPTNIRPISGWNAIKIGKNNLDFNHPEALRGWQSVAYYSLYGSTEYDATTNTITLRRTMDASILLYLGFYTAGTTVHFTVDGFDTSAIPWRLRLFPSKIIEGENFVSNISQQTSEVSTSVHEQTMTLNQDGYLYFSCYDILSQTSHKVETIVNPRTYYKTITLPQTVYGGKLDVTSGVLKVTHGFWEVEADGNFAWTKSSTYPGSFFASIPRMLGYKVITPFLCSHAPSAANISQYASGKCYCDNSLNFWLMEANSTVQDWKDYITAQKNNGTPITICFELATPQTITLTPTEVSTVLGYNNIFANSGEVEVTYRADTKKYIDGTIVDVPLAMIAPIENGTKSSKAYAVGEYFILNGNQFCKAKTAIASGATFTLNTNYTITTIGAELKALA